MPGFLAPRWGVKSRQDVGRDVERKVLRSKGARAHPGSGSGSISFDGSTADAVIEVKNAKSVHQLNGAYLNRLFKNAVQQGKAARLIIVFEDDEVVCECEVRRGRFK